ncbi:DNA (cytosine-5-)-methyltransferase [Cellulomonas sp. DKR-3]|uniref:Cytosine-specific methyltransferase n=1 Tax=Cellulomonas fulva TaxID=2835530 RepID=A0ABS5TXR7_9CELL|nr:DNA cytosine methyltransferase [Cellulomonas fulva]MBT0993894.1 DNA (cytosine-5-)-methyltransferase [Cellulomonas fulva]
MTEHATTPSAFRFIDLFAGIGGFHATLAAYGGECQYAVEIDPHAAAVYERNWGRDPRGDITADANDGVMNVPAHDVLAAGLPCQPFSKSGAQRGMDETRGTLWFNTLRIVQEHHPAIVLIENVRNLAGPRHDHELKIIVRALREEGYRVSDAPAIFSPHLLPPTLGGRPQVRERVFITATYNPKGIGTDRPLPVATMADRFNGWGPADWDLDTHLPLDPDHHVQGCDLTAAERLWIDAWDDFVQVMWEEREGRRLPGFPIWADAWVDVDDLRIPADTPLWKRQHLTKNAVFYTEHKATLDRWAAKWGVFTDAFPPSRRKLEWQAQDTARLWDTVMHFRPSGIRAKRATYVPALVAITQTSIVGPRERRLSPREAARLQGLPDGFDFGDQPTSATYKQLGNGVNIGVVWHILRAHVNRDRDILKTTAKGRSVLAAVDGAPDAPDKVLAEMFPVKG